MNKWSGKIGFSKTIETAPSVYRETYEEKSYRGDFIKRSLKWTGQKVNEDISINNQLSVLCNSYLTENMALIRYVTINNTKWKVTDITPDWPRVTLTLGGVFNSEASE